MDVQAKSKQLLAGFDLPRGVSSRLDQFLGQAQSSNNSSHRFALVRKNETPQLILFPQKQSSPEAVQELLEALGELIFVTQQDWHRSVWARKLVLSDKVVGISFNEKLKAGKFSSYKSLVESFDGAVERLVALHLANALIANCVPCKDSLNVDILEWPQTEGLASGKIPFSILPLLGAYCDSQQWESFPKSFACHVLGTVACSRVDVKIKLAEIVKLVCS